MMTNYRWWQITIRLLIAFSVDRLIEEREIWICLNYAGTDEEQLIMLSKKEYKNLFDEIVDEQEFYGF